MANFVISEIYGGSGSANGATSYQNDYVVIHNNTTQNQSLDGYALQYAASTGTVWQKVNLTGTVQAGGYYLVQLGSGPDGAPLPTPDASGSIFVSSIAGKFALTANQTLLSGSSPQGPDIVDFVGFGPTANSNEGGANAPSNGVSTSISRLVNGTQDTDNNGLDFEQSTPNPRNTSSPVFVVCYASGTLIKTARGDIAVEELAIGDQVITSNGIYRPIHWIGQRTFDCRRQLKPTAVQPVRIAAGAFGEGRPARDLYVSLAHAIAVDVLGEVLIPACRLINGTTITQVDVEEVTYWHVELDSHDILLAEGLPAESYLDCGNRRFFANADTTDLLAAPDARPKGPLPFCRPFHEAGPVVDLVRARLQDRAQALGWRKVEEAFAGLHVVADGRTIRPDIQDFTARFVVPADARDVRLVSETNVPAYVVPGSSDDRRLGVALAALTIDDGLTGARAVALDDARLGEGFHAIDGGARWTDGSAVLPAALWDGCKGSYFLRVTLAGPALSRWIAPGETAGVVNLAEVRQA